MATNGETLEELIARWRNHQRQRGTAPPPGIDELESRLRAEADALLAVGLALDEAFWVAVKRIGARDAVSGEFAGALWPPAAVVSTPAGEPEGNRRVELGVVLLLATAAALAVKVPELFGQQPFGEDSAFYARNLSFFVLPLLVGYFAWKRRPVGRRWLWLALPVIAGAAVANSYPFDESGDTLVLTVLHLPLALWLVIGMAYAGGRWLAGSRGMDFVRFSGEFFIYYVLLALGGGALIALTWLMFSTIGIDAEELVSRWLIPCGAMGAVIVCAWLVDGKPVVIGNIAPILTRVFTPLVAALLLAFLATMVATGRGISVDADREMLIAFDLLLVLVLGLLLYSVSSRDPQAPPNLFDWLTALLVVSALVADAVALFAIAGRITEFGFSPNKTAALGENLILLVNLAWSAWLYHRFLRRRRPFSDLERWQTAYLPVYAGWAAVVVVAFPPVFGWR